MKGRHKRPVSMSVCNRVLKSLNTGVRGVLFIGSPVRLFFAGGGHDSVCVLGPAVSMFAPINCFSELRQSSIVSLSLDCKYNKHIR